MSYQFDASRLRTQNQIKGDRDVASLRLLSRRAVRQARREQRAL